MEKGLYNETELLQRIASGDEQAFRDLAYTYHSRLKGFVFNMTQSPEQTEEVVQDVLLKIWMVRKTLVEVTNFQTFLFVITRNMAVNAMRSAIRQRVRHAKWQREQPDAFNEINSGDDMVLSDLVEEAINALPPQQQQAWLLSRREGLKYEQIAEKMAISRETVKRHISLANAAITHYLTTRIDTWAVIACYLIRHL